MTDTPTVIPAEPTTTLQMQADSAELKTSTSSAWAKAEADSIARAEAAAATAPAKPEPKQEATEEAPAVTKEKKAEVKATEDDGLPEEFLPKKEKKEDPKPDSEVDISPEAQAILDEFHHSKKAEIRPRFAKMEEVLRNRMEEAVKAKQLEIDELKAQKPAEVPNAAELESLRKERDRLDEIVSKTNFEQSDRFQNQFSAKERGYRDQALKVLKEAGMNGDAEVTLDSLMAAQGRRRFDALENLEQLQPAERNYLTSVFANLDSLRSEKDNVLSRHKEISQQWAQEESAAKQQMEARQREQEETVFKSKVAELSLKDPIFRQTKVEAYNLRLEEDMKKAGKFFVGEASLEDFAINSVKAARFDAQTEVLGKMASRLESALSELEELRGAGPSVKSTSTVPRTTKANKDMTIQESASKAWNELVASGSHVQ